MYRKFCCSALNSGLTKLTIAFLIVVFIVVPIAIGYHIVRNQSIQNPSPKPTFSFEPSALPTQTTSPTPSPSIFSAKLTLKITDTETEKPVDSVSVFVDDKYVGASMQTGELEIENLEYGNHKISIVTHDGQDIFEQEVNLSGDTILPVLIDMPNPDFEVTVDVKADYVAFRELGRISITLKNTGKIISQDTIALVFVYIEDNTESPIASRIIEFGNIKSDAQPIIKEIVGIDSFVWPKVERALIIIIDKWKYTPESNQLISQDTAPYWFTIEALNNTRTYIEAHPEIDGTITKIILAR